MSVLLLRPSGDRLTFRPSGGYLLLRGLGMELLDLMDALQVHAADAAEDAGGATFTDVAVGFPAAKGRCVRIFYGGERAPEHFAEGKTLNSQLLAQVIVIRAYWPVSESATKRSRVMEAEMAAFIKSFRSRVLVDSQLGGEAADLNLSPAVVDQALISNQLYAIADMEAVVDYDEFSIIP